MLSKILRINGAMNRGARCLRVAAPPQRSWRCVSFSCVGGGAGGDAGHQLRQLHNWQRQNTVNEQKRKIIPKLVYLHNPWKYLITKMNLWKLKWLWDYDFNETEFIDGSKQAAIVMTDIIRQQSADKISEYTTPVGFQQITRDMLLSRNDTRLQLVRFEKEHLRRAIPMKVATRQNFGRKYAFIDMLFVGLRNTKDFDSPTEIVEVGEIIRRMDTELKTPTEIVSVPHRIVFAEIFIRFRRDYSVDSRRSEAQAMPQFPAPRHPQIPPPPQPPSPPTPTSTSTQMSSLPQTENTNNNTTALPLTGRMVPRMDDPGWSVSFYKILTFDVLNYDPQPKKP